jgi:hypothetical protein
MILWVESYYHGCGISLIFGIIQHLSTIVGKSVWQEMLPMQQALTMAQERVWVSGMRYVCQLL